MNKPANPTCLDCKHFSVEAGYDGFYPGDFTLIDMGCAEQVWRLDNEDGQATVVGYLREAVRCDKFEPVTP